MSSSQFELLLNQFFNSDVFSNEFFMEVAKNKLNIAENELRVKVVILSDVIDSRKSSSSAVFRGKLKVEILKETTMQENIDFIMKASFLTAPELKTLSVYPREKLMYGDVVKSFEDIWRERRNVIVEFTPRCYKILTNPYDVIVLQDLSSCGYMKLDRKIGLNLNQAKLVLSKLAKFHAASAIRYQKVINYVICYDKPPNTFSQFQ